MSGRALVTLRRKPALLLLLRTDDRNGEAEEIIITGTPYTGCRRRQRQ